MSFFAVLDGQNMQISYPIGCFALLLAGPIVYTFFARRNVIEMPVSTLRFWQQAVGGQQGVGRSAQRNYWLLALRLAIVALLVGGLVKPRRVSDFGPLAILIDDSLSMSAGPRGRRPLDLAKQFAKDLVRSKNAELAVFRGLHDKPLVSSFGHDEGRLLQAIDGIEVHPESDCAAALVSAIDRVGREDENARVLFLTDETSPPAALLAEYPGVLTRRFPANDIQNVALHHLAARRFDHHPGRFEVLLEIANHGTASVTCNVDLTLSDQFIDSMTVQLAPQSKQQILREYESSSGGTLAASLDLADGLAIDDSIQVELDPAHRLSVILVGPSNRFLVEAFKAAGCCEVETYPRLPLAIPHKALVVFHRLVPAELPEHPILVVDPQQGFDRVGVGEMLRDSIANQPDMDDLLLHHVDLLGVEFTGARKLTLPSDYTVHSSSASGAPLLASTELAFPRFVLTADLNKSGLVMRDAFPVLLSNIAQAVRRGMVDSSVEPVTARGSSKESNLASAEVSREQVIPSVDPPSQLWAWLPVVAVCLIAAESVFSGRRGKRLIVSGVAGGIACLALGEWTWARAVLTPRFGPKVYACDVSASAGSAAIEQLAQIQPAHHSDRFLYFATDAGEANVFEGEIAPSKWGEDQVHDTHLAAAIRKAAAVASVGEIVLITDGNATKGNAIREAQSTGVPVSVIAVEPTESKDVWVESLEIPANLRESEPFAIRVTLDSHGQNSGRLIVRQDERLISSQAIALRERQIIELSHTLQDTAWCTLSAEIEGFDDSNGFNDRKTALVQASPRTRVLLVDRRSAAMKPLPLALEEQGFEVTVLQPGELPDQSLDLSSVGVIVLAEVAATDLSLKQQFAIREFVEDSGGGLVVLGSPRSFAAGGYAASLLAPLLPVRSEFKRTDEMPTLAVILAVDRSSSMGGGRLAMAQEATRAMIQSLGADDQLGIIVFDAKSRWIAELMPRDQAVQALPDFAATGAAGGTNLQPSLVAAYSRLSAANTSRKHLILITDGHAADAGELVASLQEDAITVSTIAIGDGANQAMLERLARLGKGRHLFCRDMLTIPQMVAQEVVLASDSAIREQDFAPTLARSSELADQRFVHDAPPLLGNVSTTPRPSAEMLLTDGRGDPLLARHRFGEGRVVAFTSDASSRWGANWLEWPEFGPFWARIMRWATRRSTRSISGLQAARVGESVVVRCDAVDAELRLRHDAKLVAEVIQPDGTRQLRPMKLVAPGRYEVSFVSNGSDSLLVKLRERDHQHAGATIRISSRDSIEMRSRSSNTKHLQAIAQVSGGRINPSLEELTQPVTVPQQVFHDLTPWLLLLATAIFVLGTCLESPSTKGP